MGRLGHHSNVHSAPSSNIRWGHLQADRNGIFAAERRGRAIQDHYGHSVHMHVDEYKTSAAKTERR